MRARVTVATVYAPRGKVKAHQPMLKGSAPARRYRTSKATAIASHHRPKPHIAVPKNWLIAVTVGPAGPVMSCPARARVMGARTATPTGPRPIHSEGASGDGGRGCR